MARYYHRTNHAAQIVSEGFRDSSGCFGTDRVWSGVWISNRPLDTNEGATGDVVLAVDIDDDLSDYEWVQEGLDYREWLVPSSILNMRGVVEVADDQS